MDTNYFENAYTSLDRMEELLHYLEQLAQRSAQPDCSPAERALLQRDLESLIHLVEQEADRFDQNVSDALLEKLQQIQYLQDAKKRNWEA